jgi:hypothetical protein
MDCWFAPSRLAFTICSCTWQVNHHRQSLTSSCIWYQPVNQSKKTHRNKWTHYTLLKENFPAIVLASIYLSVNYMKHGLTNVSCIILHLEVCSVYFSEILKILPYCMILTFDLPVILTPTVGRSQLQCVAVFRHTFKIWISVSPCFALLPPGI